jgi:hypothetical protein
MAHTTGSTPRPQADHTSPTSRPGHRVAAWALPVHDREGFSAAPIGTIPSPGRPHPPRHDPGDGFIIRYLADPIVKRALREHYADLARMEDVLRASDLDWTIVRPPRLTGKPVTGRYRTAYGQNLRRGVFVSRADVAHYMLSAVDKPETFRQTVGIAR